MSLSFRGNVLELAQLEEIRVRVGYLFILNILVYECLIESCCLCIAFVTLQWCHSIIP